MPEVRPTITYGISLNNDEFKLVCRALAGLVKQGTKDDGDALALNVLLLKNRADYLKNLKEAADGALGKAVEFVREKGATAP